MWYCLANKASPLHGWRRWVRMAKKNMQRKISTSFAVTMDLLDRLTLVSERHRINRSHIVRQALERELARYEQEPTKVDGGLEVDSGVAVRTKTASRQ